MRIDKDKVLNLLDDRERLLNDVVGEEADSQILEHIKTRIAEVRDIRDFIEKVGIIKERDNEN